MDNATRILVTSYACRPHAGSEQGNGWNWPTHYAAAGCDVALITTPRWQDEIDDEIGTGTAPNLRVTYVQVPGWPLRLGWPIGSKIQYMIWLWRAASAGKRLHAQRGFDFAHHVSWGSLAAGSFLWRVGVPFVFGPVGGGQTAPGGLRAYFGKDWRSEAIRTFFVQRLVPISPLARTACTRASLVLASNRETLALAESLGASRALLTAPDSALPEGYAPAELPPRAAHSGLRLVWVGRIFALRGLPLALDAVERVDDPLVTLDIFGGMGRASEVPKMIAARGLEGRVKFHGHVGWTAVREAYSEADALLFTSLRDSCASQLLEAMACGLPVITLDHHGAACAVPDAAGVKVPVGRVQDVVNGLADAIRLLSLKPELRSTMGEAAFEHASAYTWNRTVHRVLSLLLQS